MSSVAPTTTPTFASFLEKLLGPLLEPLGAVVGRSPLLPPDRHLVVYRPPDVMRLLYVVPHAPHDVLRLDDEATTIRAGSQELTVANCVQQARDMAHYLALFKPGLAATPMLLFAQGRPAQLRISSCPLPVKWLGELEAACAASLELQPSPTPFEPEADAFFQPALILPEGRRVVFDSDQVSAARDLRAGHFAVRGLPGTGKTLTLIFHALYRAVNHPLQDKILFACASPGLSKWVHQVIEHNLPPCALASIDVHTVEELCDRMILAETSEPQEREARMRLAAGVADRLSAGERHRALILDQTHLLGGDDVQFLRRLVSLGDVVYSDDATRPLHHDFERVRTATLRTVHRSRRSLLEAAARLTSTRIGDLRAWHFAGPEPGEVPTQVQWVPSVSKAVEDIAALVQEWHCREGIPMHRIMVSCGDTAPGDPSRFDAFAGGLTDNLMRAGITATTSRSFVRNRFTLSHPSVKIARQHELEGFDFDGVVVVDLGSRADGGAPLPPSFFSAAARARKHLALFAVPPGVDAPPPVAPQDQTSKLNRAIENKFPYPIARAWYQLRGMGEPITANRLGNVLEAVLKYLAAISLSDYLAGPTRDRVSEYLMPLLEGSFKPTAGKWIALIDSCLNRFDRGFLPELAKAWRNGRNGSASLMKLLQEAVELRNSIIHEESGRPAEVDDLYDRILQILSMIEFVAQHPLVAVRSSEAIDNDRVWTVWSLMGSRNYFDMQTIRTNTEIEKERVGLLNVDTRQMLYLYPFYKLAPCDDCGRELRFWTVTKWEKAAFHYHSAGRHESNDRTAFTAFRDLVSNPSRRALKLHLDDLHVDVPHEWEALPAGHRVEEKYEIKGILRRGTWHDVYVAHDLRSAEPIALKMLPSGSLRDAEVLERFRQEMRRTHSLHHDNIVRVLGFGERLLYHYLALELASGWQCGSRLAREARELMGDPPEALEEDVVVDLMTQVAKALAYLHRHGMIHRDVKPSNILLFGGGVVKLADFGLVDPPLGAPGRRAPQPGTYDYMSPEQRDGKEVRYSTDIYSLALVAWEMLAATPAASLRSPQGRKRAPLAHVSKNFVELLNRCLATKDSARPENGDALLRALHALG